jgi:hypothetical protein
MHNRILQSKLRIAGWMDPRTKKLPGVSLLDPDEWLFRDEVFDAQLAYRDHLIETQREKVFRHTTGSEAACSEILSMAVDVLEARDGYSRKGNVLTRPDGISVALDGDHPLVVAGRLSQHDLCVMEQAGEEHALTAALLCFPSSWSLAEKIGRPLISIHEPVDKYDDNIARRVQRLFDAIKVGKQMFRVNTLVYTDPDLFQSRREDARRKVEPNADLFLRSEFQTLTRLPQSQAVVFSIHNTIVPLTALTDDQRETLDVKHHRPTIGS